MARLEEELIGTTPGTGGTTVPDDTELPGTDEEGEENPEGKGDREDPNPPTDPRAREYVRFDPPLSTIIREYTRGSMTPLRPQRMSITNIRDFGLRVDFNSDEGITFDPPFLIINPRTQEVVTISFDTVTVNNLTEGVNEGTIGITLSPLN